MIQGVYHLLRRPWPPWVGGFHQVKPFLPLRTFWLPDACMIATEARMSRIETGRLPQLGWLYCYDDKGLCCGVVQGSCIELTWSGRQESSKMHQSQIQQITRDSPLETLAPLSYHNPCSGACQVSNVTYICNCIDYIQTVVKIMYAAVGRPSALSNPRHPSSGYL